MGFHFNNHILTSVTSPSIMPLFMLYLKYLGNGCPYLKHFSLLSHAPPPNIKWFDIKVVHWRNQTKWLHASYCHYSHVNCVLFHNVTCYTNFVLSPIHVNTTYVLNITCTLLATWRLECAVTSIVSIQKHITTLTTVFDVTNYICLIRYCL